MSTKSSSRPISANPTSAADAASAHTARTSTTNRLLTVGAAGALGFVVVLLLVEGVTRPGYNAWVRYGSELSLSDQGFIQIANFIVGGTLIALGAVGISRAFYDSTWGPRLLVLFGLSLVSAGVFVTDPRPGYPVDVVVKAPQTLHGILHGVSGLVCFTSLAAAAIVLARRFRGTAWGRYSLLTGLVVAASFITSTLSSVVAETGLAPDSPTGLLQRIGIVAGWTWFALLALHLRSAQIWTTR